MRPVLVPIALAVGSLMLLAALANPTAAQQPAPVPIKVDTTVTVPDGGTVTLGSGTVTVISRNEFGTPVLSKVPYVKRGVTNVANGQAMKRTSASINVRIIDLKAEEERFLKGK
jgi:hypothetical protein